MLEYNLATEYATLAVIVVILISYMRDYERNSLHYKFLRMMYFISLASTISTLLCNELGSRPQTWDIYVPLVYLFTILYFALIPALTVCYLFFCLMISSLRSDAKTLKKYFFLAFLPYFIYLTLLFTNIHNGNVFTVTQIEGYHRGPWYQMPYYVAALNFVLVVLVVINQRQSIHKNTAQVISLNMGLAMILLGVQAINSQVIMTGLCNTLSILAVHLYTQNARKSVDSLTGSQNNLALRYKLGELIRKEQDFSLYIFSLRGFKSINERNGLEFGDKVLLQFSRKLVEFIPYDEVFRYGGDEFAALLEKNPDNDSLIQGVLSEFVHPWDIEQLDTVQLDLICARVDYKLFGSSIKELISAADYSISVLKQTHGEPRYLYDPTVVKQIIGKSNMISQIKEAIDRRMFEICYQPMYSSRDHAFTQAEALVRMQDGKGGLLPPSQFIDVAEVTGLVVPMTFVILDIVCENMKTLLEKYGDDQPLQSISVNFPYDLFLSPHVEDHVMEILDRHNIPPSRIKIEITERTLISDEDLTSQVMERMRKLGFVFELDDFGVDYSNMSTFLNLPLHIVKIDRSVLLSALDSPSNMAFFRHLVQGIGVTGRIIIVEGVETQEQLDFVLACGCEFVQGFFFSRPLGFDKFQTFVQADNQKKILEGHFPEKGKKP